MTADFRFESPYMRERLAVAGSRGVSKTHQLAFNFASLPFASLDDQIRRMSFGETEEGTSCVHMTDRSMVEIESFVDWCVWLSAKIAAPYSVSSTWRTSRRISLSEHVIEDGMKNLDTSPFCEVLGVFEHWPEFDAESFDKRFVQGKDCPLESLEVLEATPGNLIAALGLAKLDRSLRRWAEGRADQSILRLSEAWECARIAQLLNGYLIEPYFRQRSVSAAAKERALARHRADPRQSAKAIVYDCWKAWQERPDQYQRVADFARDMLDKFPDTLKSQAVISGWARDWKRGVG